MLLTGRSVVEGGKTGPDPKETWCGDQGKSDPDDMNWEYVLMMLRCDCAGMGAFFIMTDFMPSLADYPHSMASAKF
jgi:hypothetical protein